ncbi:MAG: NAD(P)H-hydrate epimerase [Planctomycetota bacterium]|nr:MAG: NAD(P)H-hydrate epimerase [Planctomycetota bacterium]
MSPAHPRHPGDHGPGAHHPDSRRRPQEEPPRCLVLSRDAVRRVDRVAVDRYGIPSIVLMENAAIGLRERSLTMMLGLGTERVVILAGPGNNGGDGLALARHLHNAGAEPLVLLAADPERLAARGGDAATNLAIVQKMRIEMERLDRSAGAELLERSAAEPVLVVDALLGTGLRDAATGVVRDAILHVNRVRAPRMGVLAVDVPSGLDCDTGESAGGGPAVIADATVTFVAAQAWHAAAGGPAAGPGMSPSRRSVCRVNWSKSSETTCRTPGPGPGPRRAAAAVRVPRRRRTAEGRIGAGRMSCRTPDSGVRVGQ